MTPHIAGTVCTKACTPYFQGASAPHRIHWTAGKLLFRLQSEHGVRCGAAAECSFPDGHTQRSRRLRCADPYALRRQDINYKAKPRARAKRATGLRCADPHDLSCQSKWPAVTPAGHFFSVPKPPQSISAHSSSGVQSRHAESRLTVS